MSIYVWLRLLFPLFPIPDMRKVIAENQILTELAVERWLDLFDICSASGTGSCTTAVAVHGS